MDRELSDALRASQEAVGKKFVLTDQSIISEYEQATFKTEISVLFVIQPGNTAQAQECIRIANKYRIPIYPISTGKNTGYGSKVPTQNHCIVIDLYRLNKIVDFDEDLALVTVQPGVTQQQLYDFLQQNAPSLWMDATGASKDHSIIGNIAERGFGHTPYGDHFRNVGGMEVILANGEIVHTSFGRYKNAKAAGVYQWGVGPYVDGLFTQSNLAIITEVTLWLMPKPEYFQNFFFSVDNESQLSEIIDLLRPLRLDGTIRSAMHIGNDYKVFSAIQNYPWETTRGSTPLPHVILSNYAEKWEFGAWNASGALYGTRMEVRAARNRIKKKLARKVKKLRFIDETLLRIAEKLKRPYYKVTGVNLPEMLKILKPVYGLTKGVPTDGLLPSTYWRKKKVELNDPDPEKHKCGLIWCAPIAPIKGEYAEEIWQITKTTLAKYKFEPAVSITLLTERSLDCVIAIAYDRDIEGEDQRGMECHDTLLARLADAGYYPYRLGVQSMNKLPHTSDGYPQLIDGIKAAIDPNGIMSPGRYDNF